MHCRSMRSVIVVFDLGGGVEELQKSLFALSYGLNFLDTSSSFHGISEASGLCCALAGLRKVTHFISCKNLNFALQILMQN
jgi:hypothetical protein